MDIQAEKLELVRLLLDTDDVSVLQFIRHIFGTKNEADTDTVVGQTPNGQPITQQDLIERALQSDRDCAEGKVVTLEELKQEIENC